MANAPAKQHAHTPQREAAPANVRPAAQVEAEPKKRGRKPGSGSKSQTGKSQYTGGVRNSAGQLTELPKDFDSSKHVRLRATDFASEALFAQHKENNKVERKYHPALIADDGTPSNELKEFPADVQIEIGYDFLHNGEKIVGLKSKNFADRRILARAIVPALEAQIAKLNKLAKMSDDQLAKHEKKEALKKAIVRKTEGKTGGQMDATQLQALLEMLPKEMQEKLGVVADAE